MAGIAKGGNERSAAGEAAGRHGRRPVLLHYAIARREGTGPELLRVAVGGSDEVLPMFSSVWAAQSFLDSFTFGDDWCARECHSSELISLLVGPYAGVEGVLLDPLPGCLASGHRPANLMRRDDFVRYLSG